MCRAELALVMMCYLSWSDGVSLSTRPHTGGSRNLPKFLLSDGSLTLMYMVSLMFLVSPCVSLPTMVKQSGLTGCPVVEVCWCMGDGTLWCSLYLSPSDLPNSSIYCSVQLILGHWYLYMMQLLINLGSLSLGAVSNCPTVFVPLKWTWMPSLLQIFLNFSPVPFM